MIKQRSEAKETLRQLKFMERNGSFTVCSFEQRLLFSTQDGKQLLVNPGVFSRLESAGLVERSKRVCKLSPLGKKRLKRMSAASDAFQSQHREMVECNVPVDGRLEKVSVNINESPLGRLRQRKSVDGIPWISDAAFHAGERLRIDFTRGQLMQKVTASWDGAIGKSAQKSVNGAKADLTESAIDARKRLERALDYVGPDLAGVLTDVCCFLKGLEAVEKERRWPPRSAKLMIKTGLDLLARHYGFATGKTTS